MEKKMIQAVNLKEMVNINKNYSRTVSQTFTLMLTLGLKLNKSRKKNLYSYFQDLLNPNYELLNVWKLH